MYLPYPDTKVLGFSHVKDLEGRTVTKNSTRVCLRWVKAARPVTEGEAWSTAPDQGPRYLDIAMGQLTLATKTSGIPRDQRLIATAACVHRTASPTKKLPAHVGP